MKVRALLPFNAFGLLKSEGDEFEIEDKDVKAELEKLGWIEPIQEVQAKEVHPKFGRAKKD